MNEMTFKFIRPENSLYPKSWYEEEFTVSEYDFKFKELYTKINEKYGDDMKEACKHYEKEIIIYAEKLREDIEKYSSVKTMVITLQARIQKNLDEELPQEQMRGMKIGPKVS